jgi:hypothetical protein
VLDDLTEDYSIHNFNASEELLEATDSFVAG